MFAPVANLAENSATGSPGSMVSAFGGTGPGLRTYGGTGPGLRTAGSEEQDVAGSEEQDPAYVRGAAYVGRVLFHRPAP